MKIVGSETNQSCTAQQTCNSEPIYRERGQEQSGWCHLQLALWYERPLCIKPIWQKDLLIGVTGSQSSSMLTQRYRQRILPDHHHQPLFAWPAALDTGGSKFASFPDNSRAADNIRFHGTMSDKLRHIGKAVPPPLARAVELRIIVAHTAGKIFVWKRTDSSWPRQAWYLAWTASTALNLTAWACIIGFVYTTLFAFHGTMSDKLKHWESSSSLWLELLNNQQ